jgi:class 3 adenylate cyclase
MLAAERHQDTRHQNTNRKDEDDEPDNLTVTRNWIVTRFSNTVLREAGTYADEHIRWTEQSMERKFARNKYVQFNSSFMWTALIMSLGPLGLCGLVIVTWDGGDFEDWLLARIVLLSAVVAPMYLLYGVCTWKYQDAYYTISGTWEEYVLWGLLCCQSLCIALADWSFKSKYAMLVMHMSFVENFTPIGEVAMHTVTLGFGLIPFAILKIVGWITTGGDDEDYRVTDEGADRHAPEFMGMTHLCIDTPGLPKLVLDILVPVVLLFYQVVSTTRRDMSLRLDFLGNEQLQAQTEKLKVEKKKCEDLLRSMLPKRIIRSLTAQESIEAQLFPEVTVIFVEICDFSGLCSRLLPDDVVEVLNIIYLEIDWLSDELHVYKVETVGQVYMAVVGCPDPVVNHADVAAHFGLAAQRRMNQIRKRITDLQRDQSGSQAPNQFNSFHSGDGKAKGGRKSLGGNLFGNLGGNLAAGIASEGRAWSPNNPSRTSRSADRERIGIGLTQPKAPAIEKAFGSFNIADVSALQIRVGLNSGRIRAGVVGLECPRYKLFGDTVNTASRMESTCEPGRVQLSPSTKEAITAEEFVIENRGEIPVKGKGNMKTAFLNGLRIDNDKPQRRLLIQKGKMSRKSVEGTPMSPSAVIMKNNSSDASEAADADVHAEDSDEASVEVRKDRPGRTSEGPIQNVLKRAGVLNIVANDSQNLEHGIRPNSGMLMLVSSQWWAWDRLQYIFLLVPLIQKDPTWMATLKADRHVYEADTLQYRINWARSITIIWLLILGLVSILDAELQVLEEDQVRYRAAVLFRAVGCNVAGMSYLMVISRPIFRKYPQQLTMIMLVSEGAALLACGTVVYNSEPAIIAMYGAYVLFYDILKMHQRLAICSVMVIGYVVLGWCTCGLSGVFNVVENLNFLLIFFAAMGAGLHLREHLEHVAHFEQRRVQQQLAEINKAEKVSSELLNSLLPPHVVDKVGLGISPIAEHISDVTILFTDMKGFTNFSASISPSELVNVLNSMYSAFDEIIVSWSLYKVEIIGDAYFVSSGCPLPLNPEDRAEPDENAMKAVEVALAMLRSVPRVCDDPTVQMRAGLHTGSVVAGVVGKKGPRYHLFGAAVQKAEFMESSGVPGQVHISDDTKQLLVNGGHEYTFSDREVELEGGLGNEKTWLVKATRGNKKAMQKNWKLLAAKRQGQHSMGSGHPVDRTGSGGSPVTRSGMSSEDVHNMSLSGTFKGNMSGTMNSQRRGSSGEGRDLGGCGVPSTNTLGFGRTRSSNKNAED